jgi:hypothetical protein
MRMKDTRTTALKSLLEERKIRALIGHGLTYSCGDADY